MRELLSVYAENEDLLTIGAYRRGSNRTLDVAVDMREQMLRVLHQQITEKADLESTRDSLIALAGQCQALQAAPAGGRN